MRDDRLPKLVLIGVGHVAFDVLNRHLDQDLSRALWRVLIVGYPDFKTGELAQLSTHTIPPAESAGTATDRWVECSRERIPVIGMAKLIKTAELVVVVGGTDAITAFVLRSIRRAGKPTVLFCITRRSTKLRTLQDQRRTLRFLHGLADTLIHLPVVPSQSPVLHEQDPPIHVEATTCRLIARGVSGLCSPLLQPTDSRLTALHTATRLLRRGRFGGLGVGYVTKTLGIKAAVAEALDPQGRLAGGFPLASARNVWICIEGGRGLDGDVANECLETQALQGLNDRSEIHFFVVGHESPRRKLAVTVIALGFSRPSIAPIPLPSAWERAEERARQLLSRLLPEQAARYRARGFIEVKSRLAEDQVYRIHNYDFPFSTEIIRAEKWTEELCIHFKDSRLPPTDRVLAEYFLIRGDEAAYLRAANVGAPRLERAEALEPERQRLRLAWEEFHETTQPTDEGGTV